MPSPRPSRPAWVSPKVLRTEVLSGLVVALALIPEAISFSVIAGVDPPIGLFAQRGKTVQIVGLNPPSAEMHGTLSGELSGGH